jgi:LPXTG-motif cell wall-anchored protein
LNLKWRPLVFGHIVTAIPFVGYKEDNMDTNTLLIIIIIVLLVGGGGWYGRGRWF